MAKITKQEFVRNFIFGIEDSLVSTGGLLSGVAVANVPKADIIITGVVLVFVEAFSMGVGSYLSEQTAVQYATGKDISPKMNITGGIIMFASYFVAGGIPLYPYIVFSGMTAYWISVASSLVALFLLGSLSALHYKHKDHVRHGLQMLLVGGAAILVGSVVGIFFNGK